MGSGKKALRHFFRTETGNWLQRRIKQCQISLFHPEIQSLPVDCLEPHPWHPRRQPVNTEVEQLAHSILFHGLGEPLLVMPQPQNQERYWVLDGMRRLQAVRFKTLNWQTVPCLVTHQLEPYQALALMLGMNQNCHRFGLVEQGLAFRQLRQELDLTQEQLAQYLRVTQPHISFCETLVTAFQSEIVTAYMNDHDRRIGKKHLQLLYKLRHLPNTQLQVFRQMLEESWTTRRLRDEVEAILQNVVSLQRRNLRITNHYFNMTLQVKRGVLKLEDLKTQLALVNQVFCRAWNITPEELADWYEQMAYGLREEYKQQRRQG